MYTILFILIGFSFVLCYNSSRRVKLDTGSRWMEALAMRPILSKSIAGAILLVVWAAVIYLQGGWSGTFSLVTYVMALGATIILASPFRYLCWYHLLAIAVCSLCIEIIFF